MFGFIESEIRCIKPYRLSNLRVKDGTLISKGEAIKACDKGYSGTLRQLRLLRDVVNECCDSIDKIGGNSYLDVKCRNVELCINNDGDEYYRAIVSGVGPDDYRFKSRLSDDLEERGCILRIITEW